VRLHNQTIYRRPIPETAPAIKITQWKHDKKHGSIAWEAHAAGAKKETGSHLLFTAACIIANV